MTRMITERIHNITDTTTAFTTAGVDVFEAGPTNFVISFSGADVHGTYLKFDVKYPGDENIHTILSPTDDVDDIRTQSISKTFYPDHDRYLTTYTVDVSGLKNDLTTDVYRINLQLGKEVMSKYGDLKIIGSHLYTNDEGSNYCLLTLENQDPKFVSNVIIPFTKDRAVYLPDPVTPFSPNDNIVLRTEILTSTGGERPICVEVTFQEIIAEWQYEILTVGTENLYPMHTGEYKLLNHYINGYPSLVWSNAGQTTGDTNRGDDIDDFIIYVPEDGIDYGRYAEEPAGGYWEGDDIINVTILGIYPGGISL